MNLDKISFQIEIEMVVLGLLVVLDLSNLQSCSGR